MASQRSPCAIGLPRATSNNSFIRRWPVIAGGRNLSFDFGWEKSARAPALHKVVGGMVVRFVKLVRRPLVVRLVKLVRRLSVRQSGP